MAPVLYLHGFASGPQSSKGLSFRDRFAAQGLAVDLPDLAAGDFEHLTLTGQLLVIDGRVRELAPQVIIGSSLGGYLAALYAARHPAPGRRLVLLAPGFGFARRWPAKLDAPALRQWRERGWTEVYHYAEKRSVRLGYQLLEDGQLYEDYPAVTEPTLVLHGRRDDVVPPEWSEEFARNRPNVTLRLLDTDHQMLDALDSIWEEVWSFVRS
jgi:alpha-beta hydrolase superfamily lysophospholipase